MSYPKYEVVYQGDGVPKNKSGQRKVTTRGPHTFVLKPQGGAVKVTLTHNDEEKDVIPKLRVTFETKD